MLLVSNKCIIHLLNEVARLVSELWQVLQCSLYEVKAVNLVLYAHVERSCDCTFFVVSVNVEVAVFTKICELVYQLWISVESENNWLVLCEQCIVFAFAESVWMLMIALELHQVYNVYKTDLEFWNVVAEDCCCSQSFESWCITTTSHYEIWFLTIIVRSPVPDTNTLSTVLNCLIHCEPLATWVLRSNNYVYVVLALNTVVECRKKTVCIRRQVHTYNVSLFVRNMIEESWILVCESVVVLLPYVRCKDEVQRCDWCTPLEL